jgi:hypothetical protein
MWTTLVVRADTNKKETAAEAQGLVVVVRELLQSFR